MFARVSVRKRERVRKRVIERERECVLERERVVAGLKIPKSVGGRLFSGLCAFFNSENCTPHIHVD